MAGVGHTLSTFPNFLAYFVVGGILTALFVALYANFTPHRDLALIRAGNCAAAIALSGAVIGFVAPLSAVIRNSAGLLDLIVWGIVALVVQLGGFLVMRVVFPGLPETIAAGNHATATMLAGVSISIGILNAACLSG